MLRQTLTVASGAALIALGTMFAPWATVVVAGVAVVWVGVFVVDDGDEQ